MSLVKDWQYIPTEAFLFFPTTDMIKKDAGKYLLRRIFEAGDPYEDFQNEKLRQLNQNIQRKQVTVIPWFNEANKLRFLHAKKFDIDQTRKTIVEHGTWRSKTLPITPTPQLTQFLNCGAIYLAGRDSNFRPILVIDISKFDLNNPGIQKLQFISLVLATLFEFMISEVFIEGQVENYVMIINLNDQGVFSIGGLVRTIITFTNNTYRSRLFAAYIVNCPGTITMFWNGIKGLLSENTTNKIKFFSKGVPDEVFAHCHQQAIQKKFGGKRPNITGPFWPPTVLTEKITPSVKPISVSQYCSMYKKGKFKHRKVCKALLAQAQSGHTSGHQDRGEEAPKQRKVVQGHGHTKESAKFGQLQSSMSRPPPKIDGASHQLTVGRVVTNALLKPVSTIPQANQRVTPVGTPVSHRSHQTDLPGLGIESIVNTKQTVQSKQLGSLVLQPNFGTSRQSHHHTHQQQQRSPFLPTHQTPRASKAQKPSSSRQQNNPPPQRINLIPSSSHMSHSGNGTFDLDVPYQPDLHINTVKNIMTFFQMSSYKNLKRKYYEYI